MSQQKRTHADAFEASNDEHHWTRAKARARSKLGSKLFSRTRQSRRTEQAIIELDPAAAHVARRLIAQSAATPKRTLRHESVSRTVSKSKSKLEGKAQREVQAAPQVLAEESATSSSVARRAISVQDRPRSPHFAQELGDEEDLRQDVMEPWILDGRGETTYSVRRQPALVLVRDAGQRRPALMLSAKVTDAIRDALEGYQAVASLVHSVSSEHDRLAQLRGRVVTQLRGLDAQRRDLEHSGTRSEDMEMVRQNIAFLYDALHRLEQSPSECEAQLGRQRAINREQCDVALGQLYDAFEEANVVTAWNLDAWDTILPFDVKKLARIETGGNLAGERHETEEGAHAPEIVAQYHKTRADWSGRKVTAENIDANRHSMQVELEKSRGMKHKLDDLQHIVEIQKARVQDQQDILDSYVLAIEAGGYATHTGKETKHIEDPISELLSQRKQIRLLEDRQARCRDGPSPFDAKLLHESQGKYNELRGYLEDLGLNCHEAEVEEDRAVVCSRMKSAHQQWKQWKQSELASINERERYAESGQIFDGRCLARDQRLVAEYKAEYERLRHDLELLGMTVPYEDVPYGLQAPSTRPIDAPFVASNVEAESEWAESLHRLPDAVGESQWDRWRYGIGPFDADAPEKRHEADADDWNGGSVHPSEELETGPSHNTDQTKLQQWEDMMARNRAQFDQDETGRPVGPLETAGNV